MKDQLQKELTDLQEARKNNLVTVSEYCSLYHAISQKIKKLN